MSRPGRRRWPVAIPSRWRNPFSRVYPSPFGFFFCSRCRRSWVLVDPFSAHHCRGVSIPAGWVTPLRFQDMPEHGAPAQVRMESEVLGQVALAGPDEHRGGGSPPLRPGWIVPEVGFQEARKDPHERGLSGAIGAPGDRLSPSGYPGRAPPRVTGRDGPSRSPRISIIARLGSSCAGPGPTLEYVTLSAGGPSTCTRGSTVERLADHGAAGHRVTQSRGAVPEAGRLRRFGEVAAPAPLQVMSIVSPFAAWCRSTSTLVHTVSVHIHDLELQVVQLKSVARVRDAAKLRWRRGHLRCGYPVGQPSRGAPPDPDTPELAMVRDASTQPGAVLPPSPRRGRRSVPGHRRSPRARHIVKRDCRAGYTAIFRLRWTQGQVGHRLPRVTIRQQAQRTGGRVRVRLIRSAARGSSGLPFTVGREVFTRRHTPANFGPPLPS